jgi:hypothetical protein
MVVATTRKTTVRKQSVSDFFSLDQKTRDWTYRRIVIFGALIVCVIWITWAAGWMRIETASPMLANAFNMMMVVICSYVFGAIADDHLRRKAGGDFIQQTDVQSDIDPDHHHGGDGDGGTADDKNKVDVSVKVDDSASHVDIDHDINTGPNRGDKS